MSRWTKGCVLGRLLAASLLAAAVGVSLPARGAERQGTVAEGTKWATPYHVVDSGKAGPCVMIVAGVHGNEPAGVKAVEQIRRWPLLRGKLVVLPRANALALAAGKRRTPGAAADEGDMNRDFPAEAGQPPRGPLAAAIWTLLTTHRPGWLLDLHEGANYRQAAPALTGNTIIRVPSARADPAAEAMRVAVNAAVTAQGRKYVALRGPAKGSLALAAARVLGAEAMILETCRKDSPLSLRASHHRIMVHRLLTDLGMIDCGPDWAAPASAPASAPAGARR